MISLQVERKSSVGWKLAREGLNVTLAVTVQYAYVSLTRLLHPSYGTL